MQPRGLEWSAGGELAAGKIIWTSAQKNLWKVNCRDDRTIHSHSCPQKMGGCCGTRRKSMKSFNWERRSSVRFIHLFVLVQILVVFISWALTFKYTVRWFNSIVLLRQMWQETPTQKAIFHELMLWRWKVITIHDVLLCTSFTTQRNPLNNQSFFLFWRIGVLLKCEEKLAFDCWTSTHLSCKWQRLLRIHLYCGTTA